MSYESPQDPLRGFGEGWDAEDEDLFLLDEGPGRFSWERYSGDGDKNEGWGDATPTSGRRRRRKFEGDA